MQFSLSPSVEVREYDYTQNVPSVSTSIGAFAGPFTWGPCDTIVNIGSEEEYAKVFGEPDAIIASNWLAGKNFLDYSNFMKTVRCSHSSFLNAFSDNAVTVANATLTTIDTVSKLNVPFVSGKKVFKYMKVTGLTAATPYSWNGTTTSTIYITAIAHNGSSTTDITLSAVPSVADGTIASVTFGSYAVLVKNRKHFDEIQTSIVHAGVLAKYPSSLGTSLKVSFADANTFGTWEYRDEFSSSKARLTQSITRSWKFSATVTAGSDLVGNVSIVEGKIRTWAGNVNAATGLKFGSDYATGAGATAVNNQVNSNTFKLAAPVWWSGAVAGQTLDVEFDGSGSITKAYWAGSPTTTASVEDAGGINDEVYVIVVDEEGKFTGTRGTVLEKFTGLSKALLATDSSGASIYFKDYINNVSNYIWITNTIDYSWGGALNADYSANITDYTYSLIGGSANNSLITSQLRINGYSLFADSETVDISLVVGGVVDSVLGDYLVDEIAETRKDCVVFLSPPLDKVQQVGFEAANIQSFRDEFNNSTYAVMDTGWKYQYNRYSDTFHWVPLNGDVAGLCANVDNVRDPWTSPAGFNRGYIKNVVRLAYNPTKKSDRDSLYQSGINPVVTFVGDGTILFGDRTMTTKTSAFQYINVRRLFIMIEKAIATYSKFVLFEFNDSITRAQFINSVTPYLRDIQGRRGIYDFRVVADESVNTPSVIDSAGFVANILVKPSRSINFVQLNFVAVKTGASFEEIEL